MSPDYSRLFRGVQFLLQIGDLLLNALVFLHLPAQEGGRELRLLVHPLRGQHVCIFTFVVGFIEVLELDVSLLDQGADGVVDLAEADAVPLRKLPLGYIGIPGQIPQDLRLLDRGLHLPPVSPL